MDYTENHKQIITARYSFKSKRDLLLFEKGVAAATKADNTKNIENSHYSSSLNDPDVELNKDKFVIEFWKWDL